MRIRGTGTDCHLSYCTNIHAGETLDEVMAGLNPGEASHAVQMIGRAKEQFGVTVFWIEHVMAVLMEAADRIVAINYGAKLAEGTPDEVVNNEDVIEAYLGRGWRTYA